MAAIACAVLMTVWHGDYYWLTSPSAFQWPEKNGIGKWLKREAAKKKL